MTVVTFCLALLPLSAFAQTMPVERPAGPFDQGRVRLSVTGGGSFSGDSSYYVIGVGAGYFVIDGLELGLELDTRFGSGPTVFKLSPEARYFFFMVPYVHPYLKAFYRHWFVLDRPDFDTLGAGGGLSIVRSGMFFLGAGVIYEYYLDCEADDCDDIYPEIFFGFSF